jgi:peroxiredoxin
VKLRHLLLLVLLSLAAACAASREREPYGAIDLRSGEAVSVADLAGSPALLVGWTTWCAECDELLGGLSAFARSPAATGVEIVAVNLDATDVPAEIDAKIEKHNLHVALWRDRRNDFKRAFSALGVPTTVLLDADGTIVATFPGAADFDGEVADAIALLLGGPAP